MGSNCIAGCQSFSGGETRHHKHCPNYPESFSEMYDKLNIHNAIKQRELLIDFINWYKANRSNSWKIKESDVESFLKSK